MEEMKRGREQTLAFLRQHGYELDLGEWLTLSAYAEKYGVTPQVVENWITSGVIPPDCIEDLPMFNDIRMIRDQPYE